MSSQPRWQSVVFDLDGTLCNTIALILASFQHAHAEVLGVELDEQVARSWIGRTLPDIYRPWGERSEALQKSYTEFNLANLERLQTSFAQVPELLDELAAAGVQVAVATSKRRPAATRSLRASGIEQKVLLAATLEDTVRHKPHPDPIQHALTRLGASAEGAVYVGDAVVDVQAAKAAGCDQIAVTWGAGDRTELMLADPTAVCDGVDELARWLLG